MCECGATGTIRHSACPVLRHSESGPLGLSVRKCGATGSASGQTACAVRPTLCQSRSRHGNSSPLLPGCPSPPLLPVWMNVYFLFSWCWTSLPFDFPSVLVVRGGAVCLPTPPSWFSSIFFFFNYIIQRSHFGCMSEGNEITILKIYLHPLQHCVHCSIIHNSKIWAVLKGHQWVSG